MQVIGEGMGDAFLRLRLKDQQKAMDMITNDEQLKGLQLVRAPLIDLEVRGIPALEYFGGVVWQDTIQNFAQGQIWQPLSICAFESCHQLPSSSREPI